MSNIPDSEQLAGGIMDSYSDTQKEIFAIEKRKTRKKRRTPENSLTLSG